MVSNTGSIKCTRASIYFRFSSLSGLDLMEKIALMSNISKTVTHTMMESVESEYETAAGLPIRIMTFDLG